MKDSIKSLVIKTASHVIYCVNGSVSCVRDAKTGRFVKIQKFAYMIDNLFTIAKNTAVTVSNDTAFFKSEYTKLALRMFKNTAKLIEKALGDILIFTKRNSAKQGFDWHIISIYS